MRSVRLPFLKKKKKKSTKKKPVAKKPALKAKAVIKPVKPRPKTRQTTVTPPKPPPKPSPPAPLHSRWTRPPWCDKHVYVAWGFEKGDFTPAQFAERCKQAGAHGCILASDDGFQIEVRAELHNRGLSYGIWDVPSEKTIDLIAKLKPDWYAADVEGPLDPSWIHTFDVTYPDLPRCLVATGGGLPTPEVAQPWVEHWDLTMQDYIVHGPTMDPDHGENFAYWRGFKLNSRGFYHIPVIEVRAEGSPSLRDQIPLVALYGAFGIYTAEYLEEDDWQVLSLH